jgi:hypothetical protein
LRQGSFPWQVIVWMGRVADQGDQFDMEVCHRVGEGGWTGHPTYLALGRASVQRQSKGVGPQTYSDSFVQYLVVAKELLDGVGQR